MGNKQRDKSSEPAATVISPGLKKLLSALIALHLLAVFVGPWAIQPSSDLSRSIAGSIEPYIQAAGLNNGYKFFAPEPGPGHLVHYEVLTGDGRKVDGVFPDRASEWPRLLYHRYFMMSEFLNSMHNSNNRKGEAVAEQYAKSYVYHLVKLYNAQSVNLYLRLHRLPSMDDVRGGRKLDDPSLYEEHLVWDYPDVE